VATGRRETIRVTCREGVVEVRLDRPERHKATDARMVAELHAVLAQFEASPDRLLLLTGGDEWMFASGTDVAELRNRGRDDALAGINLRLFERIRSLPLPSVAAIDGAALGGGAELEYACDLRVASTRASFGEPETRLGIMAAGGGCFRLAALVGDGVATELLFTGRRLTAQDALGYGLVNRGVVARGPAGRCARALRRDAAFLARRPAAHQARRQCARGRTPGARADRASRPLRG
jgi:enoyl-CoA hydratase/carnithine racemase